MTKRQVTLRVRELGLICYWYAEWSEFIVNYRQSDPRYTSDSSYHTNDWEDAIDTATVMAQWAKETE
jgi:hypothetical protein